MARIRALCMALALLSPFAADAKQPSRKPLVHLEIVSRIPAYGGRTFGARGSYETITAIAHMRIDPRALQNRGIVDLAFAPRAADGWVEYDVDLVIRRPRNGSKARRVMVYDVVNRGSQLLPIVMGGGRNPEDPGLGILQEQGFTLVASGWQGDVSGKGLVGARFPVARGPRAPITGPSSTEMIFDSPTGNTIALAYPAASLEQRKARLTVRSVTRAPARTIPVASWRYGDASTVLVDRPADMDAGAIYRFEYIARDSRVMGLGFAATRDLIAWLRHASAAQGNPLADIGRDTCERDVTDQCVNTEGGIYNGVVALGRSQSGRYLRDFLWQGFNRDNRGRRVFEGVIPFIPGARRTFTNFRFAEPGRFSRQHEDHGVPGFTFPFAYRTLVDPLTGRRDGIFYRCNETGTCPKVFHIDTSAEFWQAGAGLVGTGGTDHDIDDPVEVRKYLIAGGAHAPGWTLPACRYQTNPLDYEPIVRSLLMQMIDWALVKTNPPEDRWPSVSRGELVTIGQIKAPVVPAAGLVWPKVANWPEAPDGKPGWTLLVPAIDADGHDVAGIRMPAVAAPTGTYVGWNLRRAGFGEGDLCLLAGSYVPFAANAAARAGDTRASLAERYPSPGSLAERRRAAVETLRRDGFLVGIDADRLLAEPIR
jgi:hypothetical protein